MSESKHTHNPHHTLITRDIHEISLAFPVVLKRWWAARLLCAQLIGNANSLSMFAFAFVRPPLADRSDTDRTTAALRPSDDNSARSAEAEAQAGAVKFTICRYIVLAVELLHLQGKNAQAISITT